MKIKCCISDVIEIPIVIRKTDQLFRIRVKSRRELPLSVAIRAQPSSAGSEDGATDMDKVAPSLGVFYICFAYHGTQTGTRATGGILMKSDMQHFFWLTAVPLYYIYIKISWSGPESGRRNNS